MSQNSLFILSFSLLKTNVKKLKLGYWILIHYQKCVDFCAFGNLTQQLGSEYRESPLL